MTCRDAAWQEKFKMTGFATSSRWARRGNVLIMVVVLLVLLALMATAFITNTRIDRQTTVQTSINTQIELLVDSTVEIATASIVDDMFGPHGDYREVSSQWEQTSGQPNIFKPWTFPFSNDASWLSARYPSELRQAVGLFAPSRFYDNGDWVDDGSGNYFVRIVPHFPGDIATGQFNQVAAPGGTGWIDIQTPADLTSAGFTSGSGNLERLIVWPAISNVTGGVFHNPYNRGTGFLDTTDRRTMMIPGTSDWFWGGTNYPALHFLDDAGNMQSFIAADADGDGIADSLLQKLPMSPINGVTYYYAVRIVDLNSAVNLATARQWESSLTSTPVLPGDFFTTNIDFRFILRGTGPQIDTQFTNVMNRRWDSADWQSNPGGSYASSVAAEWEHYTRKASQPDTPFTAPPVGDLLALSSNFVLREVESAGDIPRSSLEWDLDLSVWATARDRDTHYAVNDVDDWFEDNFWPFHTSNALAAWLPPNPTGLFTTTPWSVRTYLTTSNPINDRTGPRPVSGVPSVVQELSKIDINDPTVVTDTVASFPRLYSAFFQVIMDGPRGGSVDAPLNPAVPADPNPIFTHNLDRTPTTVSGVPTPNPAWAPPAVLLRAAIAAANTISLRENPALNNIHPFQVVFGGGTGTATVFSVRRQPFITECLIVRNGNGTLDDDYAAIEIYNPYSTTVLSGRNTLGLTDKWKLAVWDRVANTVTEIPGADLPETIGPLEYIVLHDEDNLPAAGPMNGLSVTPTNPAIHVPFLAREILGKEVVLIRQPTEIAVGAPTDLHRWAPLDNLDLFVHAASDTPTDPEVLHYARNDLPGRVLDTGYDLDASWRTVIFENGSPSDVTLGQPNGSGRYTVVRPTAEQFAPIQLHAEGWPSWGLGSGTHPDGKFARLGDILQVPFIGSYSIFQGPVLRSFNGVAVDSALAHDGDVTNNPIEQVGRFAPLRADDYPFDPTYSAFHDYYGWAADIFDYFSIETPDEPRQGLINLNTAPYEVLRTIPFWPDDSLVNDSIAAAIVRHRNTYGPFKTLFDLNNVDLDPASPNTNTFRSPLVGGVRLGDVTDPAAEPDDLAGDYSPYGTGTDSVRGDFEERYLMLNRISNLVTLRSDAFVMYVTVQGWRGAGTGSPERVAEQRRAYYIDRTNTYYDRNVQRMAIPVE